MNKHLVTFFTCYAKNLLVWFHLTPRRHFLFLYCILSIPARFREKRVKWFSSKYFCNIYHAHAPLNCKRIYVIFRIIFISNKESTCNRHLPNLYEVEQCLMVLNAKTEMTFPILIFSVPKWQIFPRVSLPKYFLSILGIAIWCLHYPFPSTFFLFAHLFKL